MSSCRGVVKTGSAVNVRRFVPPAETIKPQKAENTSGPDSRKKPGAKGSGEVWVSSDQDQEAYNQASQIKEGAREEARGIIMRANETAEDILQEAREQAEEIRRQAREEGYADGHAQGREEGTEAARDEYHAAYQSSLDAFKQDMERALASVQEAKEHCVKRYLDELKDCSVAIAEKVIRISLESSGEIIKRMILAETERMNKVAWVKIYMEKTDYEMMMQTDADVIGELSRLTDNIKFIVMEKEQSGSCIIELPNEIIDISVDTQMENMREILGSIRM